MCLSITLQYSRQRQNHFKDSPLVEAAPQGQRDEQHRG